MPTWNPGQYLKFGTQRTRPCRDLASRVSVADVRRIIDLGSGPGNSTEVLASLWPDARITALDNSAEMVETGRQSFPQYRWIPGDMSQWAATGTEKFDIVFSNAAIQWVSDHETLFPDLMRHVADGGALAVQMPFDFEAPAHRLMRELAKTPVREWHVHEIPFYYELLSAHASSVDIWETTYIHVLNNADEIVEWYKGTGLRPFLEALPTDAERERFTLEYLKRVREEFPAQQDGRVLLPFSRLFLIAYR
jgi:trans-aconitate 2-methyltransferase